MRLSIFILPVLSTIFACGPGSPAETDTDPTTGTGGEVTTTTTSTTSTSTTDTPTTSTSTTATPMTSATTATATTDSVETTTGTTDEPATTDGTSTGGPPDVAFAAQFWAGGLDHLMVRKADFKADLCLEISFARPGARPPNDLSLPTDWWFQSAHVGQGTADCLDFMLAIPGSVFTQDASGEATWDTRPFCPAVVDLDVVLDFAQEQPWVPAEATITAAAIPVQGC